MNADRDLDVIRKNDRYLVLQQELNTLNYTDRRKVTFNSIDKINLDLYQHTLTQIIYPVFCKTKKK